MFGIDSSELAVIALVALLVIGPKDLPRVMRMIGQWMAKGRAMSRHVRAGFDTMMRESELAEMQAQWTAQNEAIMKATALPDLGLKGPLAEIDSEDWTTPAPPLAPEKTPSLEPTPAQATLALPAADNTPRPLSVKLRRAKAKTSLPEMLAPEPSLIPDEAAPAKAAPRKAALSAPAKAKSAQPKPAQPKPTQAKRPQPKGAQPKPVSTKPVPAAATLPATADPTTPAPRKASPAKAAPAKTTPAIAAAPKRAAKSAARS